MKTWWTVVLGLFLIVSSCKKDDEDPLGNWIKKSDFEGLPRGKAVNFVIGDKAYLGLGYNSESDDPYLKDFWMYDPAIDRWTKVSDFPGKGRTASVAFSINGKGYVGTGYDGENKLKDFWEYDPVTNSWTQKDDFMGGARIQAVGFSVNDHGYIGTGYGDDSVDKIDFYRFDPSSASGSQWVKVQSIGGSKRRGATSFTYDNKAYVCTGVSNGVTLTDIWQYDPITDSWIKKNALDDNTDWTIVRQNASTFVLGDKAYVLLGEKSSTALKDIWEYNISSDTWVSKTDFEGSARTYTAAFTVDGKAFVTTGQSGSYFLDDVWEFKPFETYNEDD